MKDKNNILGETIRKAREEKGISQTELARRIKIDDTSISKIETGERKTPRDYILLKIAKELDLNYFKLDILKQQNEKIRHQSSNLKEYEYVGKNKIDNFNVEYENEEYISIIKVLKAYKKEEITLNECLGIIGIITDTPIDLLISDKELEENNIKYINLK